MNVAPRGGLGRRGFLRVAAAAAVGSVAACEPAVQLRGSGQAASPGTAAPPPGSSR
ncbi:autotransporter outer membrane beta-barrel domain-containing protein, partial [Microbispora triticiradicis]|nr:autotransporter outer membrane beta-barrel domain-containing protein [Microbispora triticiradicis]